MDHECSVLDENVLYLLVLQCVVLLYFFDLFFCAFLFILYCSYL